MPLFRYEAVDGAGKLVRGAMNAASEQEVMRRLAARGYTVRALYPPNSPTKRGPSVNVSTGQVGTRGKSCASSVVFGLPVSVKSKVPTAKLAMFFRQLATLFKSGIPPYQALSELANVTRERHLRWAIPAIQQDLQGGRSLSSALARFPDLFPTHVVATVWCGELSGRLDVAVDEVASDLESECSDERIGRLGWALFKVNLILLILTLPAYNVASLLRPILGTSVGDVEQSRDIIGTYLREVVHSVVHVYLPITIAIILSWMFWGHAKRVAIVRRLLDLLLVRVPIWGKLHRYRAAAKFLRALDMLYSAGVNPARAWEAASLTPRNSEVVAKLRFAGREISSFSRVSDLASVAGVLDPEDVAMITTAERAGQLPETFAQLATKYTERAATQKTVARTVATSLLISSLIAMSGVALVILVKSYSGSILQFIGT
jgi:type IV pilus assembly protein PilC